VPVAKVVEGDVQLGRHFCADLAGDEDGSRFG
jgi:hypothetical protein